MKFAKRFLVVLCFLFTVVFAAQSLSYYNYDVVEAASKKKKKVKSKVKIKKQKKKKVKKAKKKKVIKHKLTKKVFTNGLYEIPDVSFDFDSEVARLSKIKMADRLYYDGDFLLQHIENGDYYQLTDFFGKLSLYKEDRRINVVNLSTSLFKKIENLDGSEEVSKSYKELPKSQYYTEDHKPALGSVGIDEDDFMYKAISVALYGASLKVNGITSIKKAYEADSYFYVDVDTLNVKQFSVSNQALGHKYSELYFNVNRELILKNGETVDYTIMSAPRHKVFNFKDVKATLDFTLDNQYKNSPATAFPTRNLECFVLDSFGKVYAKSSSNSVVASINQDGRVIVGEPGVTKITFTNDEGVTVYMNLTVVPFGITMSRKYSFSNNTETIALKNESQVDVYNFALNYTGVPYTVSKNILTIPAGEEILVTLGKNPDTRATSTSAINVSVYSMTSGANVYEVEKDPLKISDYTVNKEQRYKETTTIMNGTENFTFSTDYKKDMCPCSLRLFITKEMKYGDDKFEVDYYTPWYNQDSYLYESIINAPTEKGIYNGPVYYHNGLRYDQSYKSYLVKRLANHGRFIDLLTVDEDEEEKGLEISPLF